MNISIISMLSRCDITEVNHMRNVPVVMFAISLKTKNILHFTPVCDKPLTTVVKVKKSILDI